MDINQLLQTIQMCLTPNQKTINQGKQLIDQNQLQPGHCLNLILIADNKSNDLYVRQFAVSHLKNTVDQYWKPKQGNNIMAQQDKDTLKQNILEALIRSVDQKLLYQLYQEIIYQIIIYEYPNNWPQIIDQVNDKLKNQTDFSQILGSLLAFLKVINVYEFMTHEDRIPLNNIIILVFPQLTSLVQKLLSNFNNQTAIIVKTILKIYYTSTNFDLPLPLSDPNQVNSWMIFIKLIFDAPLPQELETKSTNQEENKKKSKNYLWKCKKWCGYIIYSFISKYSNQLIIAKKELKHIPELFLNKYSVGFLETCVQYLFKNINQFVSSAVVHFSLKYVFHSLRYPITFQILHPHLDKILFDVCLPEISLTPDDLEQFENEPEEYLRKEDDLSYTLHCNKNMAMDTIENICTKKDSQGNSYLFKFLNYVALCLSTGKDPRNNSEISFSYKEGLFYAIGKLKNIIVKNVALNYQMEDLLAKFVLPEFQSQHGFMKARTCWLFGKYGAIKFNNKDNIIKAVGGIYSCLQSKQLVVQVKSAIALDCILVQDDAIELVRPHLQDILSVFITMLNNVDNDEIVQALEEIVERFQDSIGPYAYQLCQFLSQSFFKYRESYMKQQNGQTTNSNPLQTSQQPQQVQQQQQQQQQQQPKQNQQQSILDDPEEEDDDDIQMVANRCLNAIQKILESPLQAEIYPQLEQLIIPIINYCLLDDSSNFMNYAFFFINILLYKQKTISNQLWFYYPILIYSITGLPPNFNLSQINVNTITQEQVRILKCVEKGSPDYVEDIISPIKNFIAKGQQQFLDSKDLCGYSFVDLMFSAIEKIYSESNVNDASNAYLSTLYIALIENNPMRIDNYIPQIVDSCLNKIQATQAKEIKVINYEVISLCLWYNPGMILQYFESKNITQNVFGDWFSVIQFFKTDYDKQRLMFGLASILKLNESQLPLTIKNSFQGLIQQLVQLTTDILKVREKIDNQSDDSDDSDDDIEDLNPEEEQKEYQRTLAKIQKFNQKLNNSQSQSQQQSQQQQSQQQLLQQTQQQQQQPKQQQGEEFDEDDEDEDEDYDYFSCTNYKYDSPLEVLDEILFLENILIEINNKDQQFYNKIMSCLSQQEIATLQQNIQTAKQQYIEYMKNNSNSNNSQQVQSQQIQQPTF